MTNPTVDITLRLNDHASRQLSWFEQNTRNIQKRMADEAERRLSWFERQTRDSQQRQVARAHQTAQQELAAQNRAFQAIAEARERLSMRSHAQINADIARTRAAYQTLTHSGTLSWREQAQAAEHMRNIVRELTNEMGRLTTAQRAHNAVQFGVRVTGGLIGGAAGFAYGVREPIKDSLDLDRRIANLTVTAYSDRDVAGKTKGAKQLEAAIHNAVDVSGGQIDGVLRLAGEMISAAKMPLSDIYRNLPYLAKTAVANDADPQDVGLLANILYGQGFVKNTQELMRANNAIIAIGQKSSFEYKDQVMHLPNQLPYARTAGMSGLDAVRDVAVMNATSSVVMGTNDQAGVATHNALMKMSAQDTAKDFEKAGRGNLHDALMKARMKGISAMEFWQRIVEQEIAANPKLKELKNKLDKAKNQDDAKEILAAIEMIGRGSAVSKYFQEMRGQTGILGYQNKPYREMLANEANRALTGEFSPNENNFAYIAQTTPHKIDVAKNTYEHQKKHLVDKATPAIGNTAEGMNSWAKEHPNISQYLPVIPWVVDAITGSVAGQVMAGSAATLLLARGAQASAPTVAGAATWGAAQFAPAIARASAMFSEFSASASAFISRAPALARAAGSAAAPYAPLAARATGITAAAVTGYQAGGLISGQIDRVISELTGKTNTLGGYIYDLTHPEPVEIKPIQVDTQSHLTVSLAPGLVPTRQSSTSTSNAPKGNNTSVMFAGQRGNIWDDAP